ncbi:hypothetical protein ACTUM2_14935, partial [Listeria monocytogenes]|uniref:hypothetical protein n=1 Tax=Listeria monocytogenes TaxID=1639 RepID=UPI003FA48240
TLRQLISLDPDNVWNWFDLGDLHITTGALETALWAFRQGGSITERLAKADAGNAGWQRDHSVAYNKVGDVQQAQGDLSAALTSYQA